MYISSWLETMELKKRKQDSFPSMEASGVLKTTLSQACGQMLMGCFVFFPHFLGIVFSRVSRKPEYLSQPDLEKLGITEAKGLFGYKKQAELGLSLTDAS